MTKSVNRFFQIQLLSVSAGSSVSTTGVYPPPCLDLDPAPWARLTNTSILGKCRKERRIRGGADYEFERLCGFEGYGGADGIRLALSILSSRGTWSTLYPTLPTRCFYSKCFTDGFCYSVFSRRGFPVSRHSKLPERAE